MPRKPRHIAQGTVYHLISRFVDRDWFITNDEERGRYLRLLGRALAKSDWRCFAYAIMSNHIHLCARAGADSLASWIRRVHAPFADSMNRTCDRIGPMFVRGPKALPVHPDGVRDVIAYIHNNPVRAHVVDEAGSCAWTSHRAYINKAIVAPWLDVGTGLALAGFDDPREFDAWVRDPEHAGFDAGHDFAIANEKLLERHRRPSPDADPDSIVAAVARVLGISSSQLRSGRRSNVEVLGRQAVVRCGARIGIHGTTIANSLGVTPQAVSSIGRREIGPDAVAISSFVLDGLKQSSTDRTRSCASCA